MFDHYNYIESYKQKIVEITNNSGLTIGMAYYVLKDVLNELNLLYLKQKDNFENFKEEEFVEEVEVPTEQIYEGEVDEKELMEEINNETK
jgi:hypothetical protein